MKQQTQQKGQTVNLLFTMLLFLVFVLCALFTVLIGGKVYENINSRIEENYSGQVVLNYVANKVRQGDEAGRVAVKTMEDTPVLELTQEINGRKFITWIYYVSFREKKNAIWEKYPHRMVLITGCCYIKII